MLRSPIGWRFCNSANSHAAAEKEIGVEIAEQETRRRARLFRPRSLRRICPLLQLEDDQGLVRRLPRLRDLRLRVKKETTPRTHLPCLTSYSSWWHSQLNGPGAPFCGPARVERGSTDSGVDPKMRRGVSKLSSSKPRRRVGRNPLSLLAPRGLKRPPVPRSKP